MLAHRSAVVLGGSMRCGSSLLSRIRMLHVSGIQRQVTDEDLLKQIRDRLKTAMQTKDKLASTVFRSLLSEHQYATKADQMANKAPKPGQLISVLQKALAKRQDSAQQFRDARPAREDLASKEDTEADLIKSFLPEQIPAEELTKVVEQAVADAKAAGIEGKKLMGDVMKRVSTQVDKARAPGAMISDAVKKCIEQ